MSNTQNLFSQPSFPLPYPGQSFFGSGNIQIYSSSGTYIVPPGVTRIRVRVWGAGGSGGVSGATSAADFCQVAAGGGGGGHGIKVIDTTPGTSYTVTIGAGGAPVTAASLLQGVNGNAGGTSSFGSVVSCTGGGGGQGNTPVVGNSTATGGAGGTSTGGDVNYSGGAGGNAQAIYTSITAGNSLLAAGGGGSAGSIFGNGFAGGAAVMSISGTSSVGAGGGGGVGGKGGNATATNVNGCYGTGGGTFGPGNDNTGSGALLGGPGFVYPVTYSSLRDANGQQFLLNASVPAETRNTAYYLTASTTAGIAANMGQYPDNAVNRFPGDILISQANQRSTSGSNTVFTGPGCGGSFQTSNTAVYAGVFGGGYGAATVSSTSTGGFAGIGGGGGGCALQQSTFYSGQGGNGMVVVEW